MFNQSVSSRVRTGILAATLIALSGCGGGGDSSSSPAPAPAPGGGNGSLRVALTDAPACGYDHVYVTVERVRVHASSSAAEGDSGWSDIVVNPVQRIDLLGLTNGVLAELGQMPLPAGQYTQVRLVLAPNGAGAPANAVVPSGGTEVALDTPSATQSGLKLIHGFTVQPNSLVDLVLDFDACRSIVRKGNGGFNLKPVIAVIPRTTTGVVGTVDPMLTGVTVSAQKAGVVIRSTTPNATGAFVLSGLDPAQSPYDVVFAAAGRATAVVAAVPVALNATTMVSSTATPITLPVSASGIASGTVLPLVAAPSVRAVQAVGVVPKVEVGHANAESNTGAYLLNLPAAAPLLATYATPLPLTFAPQNGTAAAYTLEAFATGYTTQTKPITVGPAAVVSNFTLVAVP